MAIGPVTGNWSRARHRLQKARRSRVLYCWQKEHHGVGVLCVTGDSSTMPVSCCAVNCENRFQKGSGI